VEYWQEAITGELYFKAMEAGEVFFTAVGEADGSRAVIGFTSDSCTEGQKHGTSVYLRGRSARCGVGSALLARTEAHAASNGATSIEIEASLAGFRSTTPTRSSKCDRGEARLTTWRSMECVFHTHGIVERCRSCVTATTPQPVCERGSTGSRTPAGDCRSVPLRGCDTSPLRCVGLDAL
jgi:GNAT superfamily N-acetyltransferase